MTQLTTGAFPAFIPQAPQGWRKGNWNDVWSNWTELNRHAPGLAFNYHFLSVKGAQWMLSEVGVSQWPFPPKSGQAAGGVCRDLNKEEGQGQREMPINPQWGISSQQSEWPPNNKCRRGRGERETAYTVGGNVHWADTGEQGGGSLQNQKLSPAIPHLGICLKRTILRKNTCIPVFMCCAKEIHLTC